MGHYFIHPSQYITASLTCKVLPKRHQNDILSQMNFLQKLKRKWDEQKFLCIGLDKSDFEFNKKIIAATAGLVCAYKPNSAFYEAGGKMGWETLYQTISYIHQNYPDIPVILDAKRGDIGHTNEAYAKAAFDELGVDAITVHPYLGKESLEPFLKRSDKGIFVLVKTSNPGAGEFQDLKVDNKPLYQIVAEHIKKWDNSHNLAVVVGATYPEELGKVREIIGDMPILVPGIGAQGGGLEEVLRVGLDRNKQGLIIHSSRTILDSPDPKKAAEDLHKKIQGAINYG